MYMYVYWKAKALASLSLLHCFCKIGQSSTLLQSISSGGYPKKIACTCHTFIKITCLLIEASLNPHNVLPLPLRNPEVLCLSRPNTCERYQLYQ